jgi:hypothetical protein
MISPDLEKEDSGIFECVASSRTGKYVWKAYLTVDDTLPPNNPFRRSGFDLLGGSSGPQPHRPREPLKPQVIQVDSSSVTIAWHPRYFLNNEVDFSKEEKGRGGNSPILQFSKGNGIIGSGSPSLVLSSKKKDEHDESNGDVDSDDGGDDDKSSRRITENSDEEDIRKSGHNGQTNSRNGHRRPSAFVHEQGINTIRKLNGGGDGGGLSSSVAKSISFNEEDDDDGKHHPPPSSPIYIDDDDDDDDGDPSSSSSSFTLS